VCDRIAILSGGELKLLGTVDELLRTRGETQIVTPDLSPEALAEVEAVLARHGVDPTVTRPKKTLEDLFLRTVSEAEARPGRTFSAGDLPGEAPPPGSSGPTSAAPETTTAA
jgi:ABC-2 type transport system ATP-binding protein